jgi:hypothetical protein
MSIRNRKSINFMVSNAFPGAFFLDDALWRVSTDYKDLEELPHEPDIVSASRIRQHVFDAILRSWRAHNVANAREDPLPVSPEAEFVYLTYNRIRVEPGTEIFVCGKCDRIYTWDQVEGNKFLCLHDKDEQLAQLAHIFVHGLCGQVTYIQPQTCWNQFNGNRCGEPLRLHLEYSQMINSYWWCPKCRYERKLEQKPKEGSGWELKDLWERCNQCSTENNHVQMTLSPARTIYKAQRVDLVDMPFADYRTLINEWFGGMVDESEILKTLPDFLKKSFIKNPQTRANILQRYREDRMGDSPVMSIPPIVQEELSNLAGSRSAVIRRADTLSRNTADFLARKYGLNVSLLDNLAIIRATYGYLAGGSTPEEAILRVFPMAPPRYAVLTQRLPTEALLFELVADRVLSWLHDRDLLKERVDEKGFREYLVTCEQDDPVLVEITSLIHTASHALRRSSERYTGMGRDVVDELLFPRALAWVLYNNRGSELGMFTTTYEGRLREWLDGTKYDLTVCPFDPICMHEEEAACPGCLYVGERGCTTFWNRYLDRRDVVTLDTSKYAGFWG